MSTPKEKIYYSLQLKLKKAGFVFEKEQKPRNQPKREKELKFTHPSLNERFKSDGLKNRALKYYIKPLSGELDCDIGLTVGKTSPLLSTDKFQAPNAVDTFDNCPAWVNTVSDKSLDALLESIEIYLVDGTYRSIEEISDSFDERVSVAIKGSAKARRGRLMKATRIPERTTVTISAYKRNPDVVAEVLIRANGKCEICDQVAPFLRRKDKTPYLEVHHKQQLANGGEDSIDNAVAICPNCHRKEHFG